MIPNVHIYGIDQLGDSTSSFRGRIKDAALQIVIDNYSLESTRGPATIRSNALAALSKGNFAFERFSLDIDVRLLSHFCTPS